MFCAHGGSPSDQETVVCKQSGVMLSPTAVFSQAHEVPEHPAQKVHPWIRYWARMFDITAYAIVMTRDTASSYLFVGGQSRKTREKSTVLLLCACLPWICFSRRER